MKKVYVVLSLVLVLCLCNSAFAEGMGVQVIGGPDTETEPVSLDDVKLNTPAQAEGQFTFKATSFEYVDYLLYYKEGAHNTDYHYDGEAQYTSGADAEYAILRADVMNEKFSDIDFIKDCTVVVYFDDTYQYAGWVYQYNYNNGDGNNRGGGNVRVVNPKDNFAIGPMYEGHYAFGCTLPNAVVSSKKPLRMVITIDGNEITYHIRK